MPDGSPTKREWNVSWCQEKQPKKLLRLSRSYVCMGLYWLKVGYWSMVGVVAWSGLMLLPLCRNFCKYTITANSDYHKSNEYFASSLSSWKDVNLE